MSEIRIEGEGTNGCETCAKHAQEAAENYETAFAFLLALMPLVTLTFFGQTGLL